MAVSKRNVRGLEHIGTRSGRAHATSLLYKAYMRIAALELEKLRRAQERDSASLRMKIVEERVREIEAEKAALLQSLTKVHPGSQTSAPGPAPGFTHPRSAASFKFRY